MDGLPDGWVVDTCDDCDTWLEFTPDVRDRAASSAILFMWAATGRRYGTSGRTVQVGMERPPEPLYQTFPVTDYWAGLRAVGGLSGEGCQRGCEVELPGPVADIVQVRLDGFAIDPVYEVRDGHLLARTDGQCWPTCQGGQSVGSVPVFEVDYHYGLQIPPAVQFATEMLACEYGQMFTGGSCRLPGRMRSLRRQGVDLEMEEVDVKATPGRLRTGIKEIDDVLDAVNPYGQVEPREVFSPDDPQVRTVTWPPRTGWPW